MNDIERAIEYLTERYLTMSMCLNKEDCLAHNANIKLAITALQEQLGRENRRADIGITTTENEPLTLDELQGMDGCPVYIKHLFGEWHWDGWHILESCEDELIMHDGSILLDENYGKTWTAYRRKPEEVEG